MSSRILELFLIDQWSYHVYIKSVINIFNMFTLLVLLSELTIGVWTLSILPKMCPGLVLFIYVLDKFGKSNVYIVIFVEIWSMKFNCFTYYNEHNRMKFKCKYLLYYLPHHFVAQINRGILEFWRLHEASDKIFLMVVLALWLLTWILVSICCDHG